MGTLTKPMLIRTLLLLYPRQWRAEYGGELRAIMESGRIGAIDVFDVAWNAVKLRLAATDPWVYLFALWCVALRRTGGTTSYYDFWLLVALVAVSAFWSRLRGRHPYNNAGLLWISALLLRMAESFWKQRSELLAAEHPIVNLLGASALTPLVLAFSMFVPMLFARLGSGLAWLFERRATR